MKNIFHNNANGDGGDGGTCPLRHQEIIGNAFYFRMSNYREICYDAEDNKSMRGKYV